MNGRSVTARWMPALVLCASAMLAGTGAAHAQPQEDPQFPSASAREHARDSLGGSYREFGQVSFGR